MVDRRADYCDRKQFPYKIAKHDMELRWVDDISGPSLSAWRNLGLDIVLD